MKILLIGTILSLLFFYPGCQKEEKPVVNEKPVIYDEDADTRQDIQTAVDRAKDEGKHVLLMFGGNWCPWCHMLHDLIKTNEAVHESLHENYILVMVNVSGDKDNRDMALNEEYGNPYRHGFPVLVVLDSQGKQLFTQETGSLEKTVQEGEEKGHDPEKVLAFLSKWKPS
jgi:thioredoxin-related protein